MFLQHHPYVQKTPTLTTSFSLLHLYMVIVYQNLGNSLFQISFNFFCVWTLSYETILQQLESLEYIKVKLYFYMLLICGRFKCHGHNYTIYISLSYCNILYQTFEKCSLTFASPLHDCFNDSLKNIERLLRRQIPIDFISQKVTFLPVQAAMIL